MAVRLRSEGCGAGKSYTSVAPTAAEDSTSGDSTTGRAAAPVDDVGVGAHDVGDAHAASKTIKMARNEADKLLRDHAKGSGWGMTSSQACFFYHRSTKQIVLVGFRACCVDATSMQYPVIAHSMNTFLSKHGVTKKNPTPCYGLVCFCYFFRPVRQGDTLDPEPQSRTPPSPIHSRIVVPYYCP